MTSVPNSAVEPGPAPRRFYSTRQKTRPVQLRESKWEAFEVHGSRESGLYRGLSMGNLRQEKSPSNFSYPVWGKEGDSPVSLGGLYDVSDVPTRHRRNRAQELLKKLTGLGMKKKESGMVESRRAVAAMA